MAGTSGDTKDRTGGGERPSGWPVGVAGLGRRGVVAALVVAAIVLMAAMVWVVTTGGGGERDREQEGDASAGLAHVHGLAVDPSEPALYVAAHHGVWRIAEDGYTERVGRTRHEMTGLAVAGPDHFLASGRAQPRAAEDGTAGPLGLVESTDGGETWETASLAGEATFEPLVYAHDRVYGWDTVGRRLLVSTDMARWETRSTVDLFSLAVDPGDADHLVAATAQGLQLSSDGGRTWTTIPGALEPALVAWDRDSGLWGVDPGGLVFHATAPDTSWEQTGTLPGTPQALVADGETLYAATAAEGGTVAIHRSTDAGASWDVLDRDRQ